tara:strand:- start:16225 stop:17796 length:1572 start_codon:yes stop_codon:yes gene_type:complete
MSRVDASTSLSQSYSSFSGVDIRVIINGVQCGSIQHLSYMIQREKAPNYVMGSVDPVSFARGKRGINGVIRGLLLDVDLLRSESFDNEKALLDRDELFFKNIETEKTETTTRVEQPKYRRHKPNERRGRWEYIYDIFISFKVFPGGSATSAAKDCFKSAVVGALETLATSIISGGLLSVPAASNFLREAIADCVGGMLEALIYEGGIAGLAGDALLAFTVYTEKYEENLEEIEMHNRAVNLHNSKQLPTTITSTKTIKSSETAEFGYTIPEEYNLENLGSNYLVNNVEYLDQILPFDIVIVAVNEYGQSAQMRLYGCEILSANSEFSVDQMTIPFSLNFVARNILPWRSFDLLHEGGNPGERVYPIKQIPTSSSSLGGEPVAPNINDIDEFDADIDEFFMTVLNDPDLDNDGIPNEEDPEPEVSNDPLDNDNTDQDDPAPLDPTISEVAPTQEQIDAAIPDNDGDGLPNVLDPDDDNDGLNDEEDPRPLNNDNTAGDDFHPEDTDGDGAFDADDADPNDPNVQ